MYVSKSASEIAGMIKDRFVNEELSTIDLEIVLGAALLTAFELPKGNSHGIHGLADGLQFDIGKLFAVLQETLVQ